MRSASENRCVSRSILRVVELILWDLISLLRVTVFARVLLPTFFLILTKTMIMFWTIKKVNSIIFSTSDYPINCLTLYFVIIALIWWNKSHWEEGDYFLHSFPWGRGGRLCSEYRSTFNFVRLPDSNIIYRISVKLSPYYRLMS